MRILYLLKKEFKEIFRQKELLPLIFIAPLIQIIVLGYVVRTDITNIPIKIENHTKNINANRIINRIQASARFNVREIKDDMINNKELLRRSEVKAVIIFWENKKRNLINFPKIQILMDGVDSNTSAIAAGYLNKIIKGYLFTEMEKKGVKMPLESHTMIRFNPNLKSINYMGPGIVALLLTILTLFLTSVSIVREKEQQTMDTLLVSRLKPLEIYIGKALPLGIMGMIQMALGVTAVILWFDIPVRGNLIYLFLAALIFLPAVLSYALLISTLASTQQQALFFSWFSMITFILMSGLFTPITNIPKYLQWLAHINPLTYLIKIIREIFLKGNTPEYFINDLLALTTITVVVITVSLITFKRSFVK